MASLNPIETIKNIIPGLGNSETNEETTSGNQTPPVHPDESPIDPDSSKARLERALHQRPEKKDLVDKNILKNTNVAPSLQAAQADLKRAQIGDTLEHSLQERVRTMAELESRAAGNATPPTQPDESPIDTESSRARLEKSLQDRPGQKDLVDKNILKGSNAAPALQAAQAELQRAQLEDKLEHALQQRPKPGELVSEGILENKEAPPA